MLALALIGIAAALYVAHGNYTGQSLWCPILDGCNAVVNSPYSRVFGVPMSYFGFIYFLYMFRIGGASRFRAVRAELALACDSLRRDGRHFFDVLYLLAAALHPRTM
jgi:uncharacterized membrane protein